MKQNELNQLVRILSFNPTFNTHTKKKIAVCSVEQHTVYYRHFGVVK